MLNYYIIFYWGLGIGDNKGNLDMSYMFNGCNSLSSINIFNIELYNSNGHLNMDYMFNGCTSLNYVNIYNISVEGYIHMDYLFLVVENVLKKLLKQHRNSILILWINLFKNVLFI